MIDNTTAQEIYNTYASDFTLQQTLAKRYKVSVGFISRLWNGHTIHTIDRWWHRQNPDTARAYTERLFTDEEVIHQYSLGYSTHQIAKKHGTSSATIYYILKGAGVTLRKKG